MLMNHKIGEAIARMKDKCLQLVLEEDTFALEVMIVSLLKGFERLYIAKYDRTTDPLDHLRTFVDLIRVHNKLNVIICWASLPTLRRASWRLGSDFISKSIRNFDDFWKHFAAYFASSKRNIKTPSMN
ncbi:Uncharacterized protein Adt_20926 [Abeliophyllum distichum]|uniref:Uncharacterized protein n=1 Tax=Abeliophyllum distichum TaxID=126358 RepID=A0ABD1SXW3_9LAMI